jgi:shikimate dehydrogenase
MKVVLIGRSIGASLTPAMHEEEGRAQGLHYSYQLDDLATPSRAQVSLAEALVSAEQSGCRGANVTYPYKQEVLALLDEVSPDALAIGAVNTVLFKNGRRLGHNTDYIGFRAAFQAGLSDLPHDHALLVGAGGAGAAVGLAMIDAGVSHLYLHDKNSQAEQRLAERLSVQRPNAEIFSWSGQENVYGVINATPVGMAAYPGMAIDLGALPNLLWAGDIVYYPLETALLHAAKTRGLRIMNGGGMAVGQAAAAFELFSGQPANAARMAAHFRQLTQQVGF